MAETAAAAGEAAPPTATTTATLPRGPGTEDPRAAGPLDEIIPGVMYLSSLAQAENFDLLKSTGITHVLTVGGGMPALYTHDFSYQLVDSIDDEQSALIIAHFAECFSFIEHAIAQSGRILVHCEGGVSRSATICAAYLMKLRRWTVQEAVSYLQAARPVVAPNVGFREQLELFYQSGYKYDLSSVADITKALEKDETIASAAPKTTSSILSQDMFETPPENLSYELETSSKANTFIDTILSETMPKKKKAVPPSTSADDASLGGYHRAFVPVDVPLKIDPSSEAGKGKSGSGRSLGPKFASVSGDSLMTMSTSSNAIEVGPAPARTLAETRVSSQLFDLTQESLSGDGRTGAQAAGKASPISSLPPAIAGRSQDDQDAGVKRLEASRQGSLRRFRTSSSTACSGVDLESSESVTGAEEDQALAALPASPLHKDEEDLPPAPPDTTEQATKAVGKVLLGYAMTPADERVVTQWLADKPQALTGGEAFKGLRQALRMMRRFNNDPARGDEDSMRGVEGLQHSLEHVSAILQTFTGFPLHSQEFMRMLQSDQGLDSILHAIESEFKTALDDVRRANKVASPDDAVEHREAASSDGQLLSDPGSTCPANSAEPPSDGLKRDSQPESAGRPRMSAMTSLPPRPNRQSSGSGQRSPPAPPKCGPVSPPGSPPATLLTSHPLSSTVTLKKGTMTPGRPRPRSPELDVAQRPGASKEGEPPDATTEAAVEAAKASEGDSFRRRRRRSATIDLLLLLSKLGLRREYKVSDHLYHSLSQFLEGGNKEMGALENLDRESAIELLGYLESFPEAMKRDPRMQRLAQICKARLVLMVAIDSADEICDELLAQPHVSGHVRDVTTYCLNFSGALIGTQMSIIRKARQDKAAARIQVWRRSMHEDKVLETLLETEGDDASQHEKRDSLTTESLPRTPVLTRRSSSLRSWQSFEVTSPAGAAAAAVAAAAARAGHEERAGAALSGTPESAAESPLAFRSPAPSRASSSRSGSPLPSGDTGTSFTRDDAHRSSTVSRPRVQSKSTISSINLVLTDSNRRSALLPQLQSTLHPESGNAGAYAPRLSQGSRSRANITMRPKRSMISINTDVNMQTYPLGPNAAAGGGLGAKQGVAGGKAAAALGGALSRGGDSAAVSLSLQGLSGSSRGGSQQIPVVSSAQDFASVASSNSISNSPFYLSGELSPKAANHINPVHALYGIVRHLSRVVVSEARQNLANSYEMSQKLKTLQGHAKRLKSVHPIVCVADEETREGLKRLPKASEMLGRFLRDHKFGGNQSPYCYDYQLQVLAFFPPCEFDTATQPPNDTSADFRKILSTVFDLMPVDSDALNDLTETAVLSQHASAGYALTTTLHYVDKLCKTGYMVEHHLGDETCGMEGTVTGGYVRFDAATKRYVFTEESGHYGLRWTYPGTRQSLDTFMANSNLADAYSLKPYYRQGGDAARSNIADIFQSLEVSRGAEGTRPASSGRSGANSPSTPYVEPIVAEAAVEAAADTADLEWDFG